MPNESDMKNVLCTRGEPEWLFRLAFEERRPSYFPLSDILEHSCYYPASGLDTAPIKLLSGHVHSFVYCDYSVEREEYKKFIAAGIPGLSLVAQKFVRMRELAPPPHHLLFPLSPHGGGFSEEPLRLPHDWDHSAGDRVRAGFSKQKFFAHWSIWEDDCRTGRAYPRNSPISLLFISGEGVATYQALYLENGTSPEILSVLQPGHAFGGNWTNFFDQDGPLWTTIKSGRLPDKLLLGELLARDPLRGVRFFDLLVSVASRCPYGDQYLGTDVVRSVNDLHANLYVLDKRSAAEKEQDRVDRENKRIAKEARSRIEEEKRRKQQVEWFEHYRSHRLKHRKAPAYVCKLTNEEELEKQRFDRSLIPPRATRNIFGALKRGDRVAIAALKAKGADLHWKNANGLSAWELAEMVELAHLLVDGTVPSRAPEP